jgi:hypothetical protein
VDALNELAATVGTGEAVLFTGAGFAVDARDTEGNPLPTSSTMTRELWNLCFDDGEPDDSTLSDLYDVAMQCDPDALRAYLERRLIVGATPLPSYYRAWFAAPWRRHYTLNVDDLEVAAARQFGLTPIDVLHLNGKVGGGVEDLTFSTLQYAARLDGRERAYEQLARDLVAAPFVFVGTTLDEAVMWKHLERERRSRDRDLAQRPRSFLITPSLARARQALLASMRVEWIATTAAEAASALPSR